MDEKFNGLQRMVSKQGLHAAHIPLTGLSGFLQVTTRNCAPATVFSAGLLPVRLPDAWSSESQRSTDSSYVHRAQKKH